MSVTAKQLLEAAQVIGQRTSEVDLRNAASRAYYATYHRCRPIAVSVGLAAGTTSVHSALIDTLTKSLDRKLKSVGYMLDQCRGLRAKADYQIESDFSPEETQTMARQCEEIWRKANLMDPEGGS